ncbi:MAG: DUF2461 domain-containing protein [Candidatus Aminicenantaceae bacterium]
MPEGLSFEGFFKETIDFFMNLKKNNSREWFDSKREDYERYVLEPSRAFVKAMGECLKAISPNILAIPKVNRSLFRITRDTRFSFNKAPYKTNLGIYFWEGSRSRLECSGFYFHLEPPRIILGVGVYIFPRNSLDRFRLAVVDPEYGEELSGIIDKISKKRGYELGGKHYKRIPSGFDASHPNAELLLHNGLYASYEKDIPEELYSSRLISYCWEKYYPLAPLHRWLVLMSSFKLD